MSKIILFFSFFFAIALVLLVIVWLIYAPDKVLQDYKLKTPLKQLKVEQIDKILKPYMGSSFWRLDIEKVHRDLVRIDWVYQAQVVRKWPSYLEVKILEQIPVARWGDSALLNQNGDIFYPYNIKEFVQYVKLDGEDIQAKKMLKKLDLFQIQFQKLGWLIKQIDKRVDEGWLVTFVSNKKIIIGNQNWFQQINRFIYTYPRVKKEVTKQAQVYDLRYSNGFVIRFSQKL